MTVLTFVPIDLTSIKAVQPITTMLVAIGVHAIAQ